MSVQPGTKSSKRLGRTLGTTRDWRRRLLLHYVPLAVASALVLALFMSSWPFTSGSFTRFDMGAAGAFPQPRGEGRLVDISEGISMSQLTVATGYVATVLLGLTLLIGPANLLFRRHNPVSNYLRRDLGTWTVIFSVVHVILGLQLHSFGGISGFLTYFVADGRPLTNSFGLGNWTGLAATVLVVGLLAISTDRSMRELKPKPWKNLQRLNYALFALVVLHAFFYGALLRMASPFTLVLIITVTAVLVGQLAGMWLWRRRQARAAAIQRERQPAGITR